MIYYDDYTLLKNVGYDINNSDDLFKLVCDNPRNAAKYFDILSLCYSVVDDSGFNKIWMPAETDENGNNLIYTGVFGIMYESPHYSSFKMRNWLRYDANGFGVLKISATDGNPLDLYVGIVNAPFVNYLPEGGEIKCQLYALPLNVRFYADADAATNDGKFFTDEIDELDSCGEYDNELYFGAPCEDGVYDEDYIDGSAIVSGKVIGKELCTNQLTGLSYVHLEVEARGMHIDLLVAPEKLSMPLEEINYIKGAVLLYANVEQKKYSTEGYNKKISLDKPVSEEYFNQEITPVLMNLRDLAYEHLIVELGEHFTNGLDYIQTARNSDEKFDEHTYEVEVCFDSHLPTHKMYALRDYSPNKLQTLQFFKQLCVEDKLPDLSDWTDITDDIFGPKNDEYYSENSIFFNIKGAFYNGKLPDDYKLPRYGAKPMFADGAQDGTAIYHLKQEETDENARLLEAFKLMSNADFPGAEALLESILQNNYAIKLADDIHTVLLENYEVLDAGNIYRFAVNNLLASKNKELVKADMVILELFPCDEPVRGAVRILGQCEEFTLFAIFVMRKWDNGNEEIFALAKKVRDWGRIHAIEYLEADTEEKKEWLLYEGLKNIFMPEYSALTVFNKAEAAKVFAMEELSYEIYHALAMLLEGLLDEGPVPGISQIEDRMLILQQFLDHSAKQELTVADLNVVLLIAQWCDDLPSEEAKSIKEKAEAILFDSENTGVVQEAIKKADGLMLAEKLGLPFKNQLLECIEQNFEENCCKCFWLMEDADYVEKVVEVFCNKLPFDIISAGAAVDCDFGDKNFKYYAMLESILTNFGRVPVGREPELAAAAVQCPSGRVRRQGVAVLEVWVENTGVPLKELLPQVHKLLTDIIADEVCNDITESINELIAGKTAFADSDCWHRSSPLLNGESEETSKS